MPEEHAGFGALDDAVVVGAGHRHHFADAERDNLFLRDAAVFGGVIHGADGDDGALAASSAAGFEAMVPTVPGLVSEMVVP